MNFLQQSIHSWKSVGKLIFNVGLDDPIIDGLEALLGQQDASQLWLYSPTENEPVGVISGEQGKWWIVFMPLLPF